MYVCVLKNVIWHDVVPASSYSSDHSKGYLVHLIFLLFSVKSYVGSSNIFVCCQGVVPFVILCYPLLIFKTECVG